MEIRLFGKSLFKFSKTDMLWAQIGPNIKESKYLIDFYHETGSSFNSGELGNYIVTEMSGGGAVAVPIGKKPAKKEKEAISITITPKGVYEMKMLHDESFKLNTDPDYVDSQISDFKDKLSLIKSEEYDMRRGVSEISSVVMRLENRKKYEDVKDFFEEYPYTTTSKISDVVKKHTHLKLGQVAQFLADMPKEAVDAMKEYNRNTEKICKKQAVFYIIADQKDFKKSEKRRDPILLAQSPFGHFWQILGAWDKEMMLLEEL